MKNIILVSFILLGPALHAQYFYNDIIGTQETNRQMQTFLANKVSTVASTGYDQRGVKATDYSELYEVKENGRALRASSFVNLNKSVIYSRFDEKGRVINMIDSSTDLKGTTTYDYDAAGRLIRVQNTVKDSISSFNQVETHFWTYNPAGKPEKMWRIITSSENSATDSLEIRFVKDENGNIGEERTFKNDLETGYLYYYYDDKGRLTDIVRYHPTQKKLLPDLMFEYDEQGRVIQKITTLTSLNVGNYLIWRYIYNDKGLKTKEALFNKDKELTGKIDYNYTFTN